MILTIPLKQSLSGLATMPRQSLSAIQRDREKSRERYWKNREVRQKQERENRSRRYEERPFIGWDSEGYDAFQVSGDGIAEKLPQRTMLFGCSLPGEFITGIDLSTGEMLALLLRVESQNPDSFHVGYSFEYDVNQILKDLSWKKLAILKLLGHVKYEGYRITHIPHKLLRVSRDGTCATIYDVFGFFHSKYETALLKYGIVREDSDIFRRIHAGKERRGHFTYADLPEVLEYWKAEISLFAPLMECVRESAYSAGFRISQWHGPGALASFALASNGIRRYMSHGKIPARIQSAIRHAYAGGRFQAWRCGWYHGNVYTLDKNSAYVQAIALLPRLDNGKWEKIDASKVKGKSDIARFGLYRIQFDAQDKQRSRAYRAKGIPEPPYPLFHRNAQGGLSWPDNVVGWYWSPEARLVADSGHAKFLEAYEYRDDGSYPFAWVNDAYQARVWLQEHGNPAEKAFKWALAAMYGAFARRVGWNRRNRSAPPSHELAWAGYITSHCRAAIYDPMAYAYSKGALISADTDGITSRVPFPESIVPEGFGSGLGQWKQDHYAGILYWQNGIYWLLGSDGEWQEAKSRGIPRGVIGHEEAFDALESASFTSPYRPAKIVTMKTRYIGYRQALNGQFDKWRHWITEPYELIFGGTGKGHHSSPFCRACHGMTDEAAFMHTITHLPPRDPFSAEHKLPWLEDMPEVAMGLDFFATEDEIFSDEMLEDRL